jgi:DNA repair exonuclease SbcCD nuclease subunit
METCTVIHLHGGVVNDVFVIQGEDIKKVTQEVETKFINICNEFNLFKGFDTEEVQEAIENGYSGEFLNDEVVIHWPVTYTIEE